MNPTLRYREGYKYQVCGDYQIQTRIKPPEFIRSDFLRLDTDGMLYIFNGYAWDGPSGPAIDTTNFMIGSLVHDGLTQLMAEGYLDPDVWREPIDKELVRLTKNDGMSALRRGGGYGRAGLGSGAAAPQPRPQ